ncbi:hypothetical protein L596_023798 [Steinernema carpocapsae]|uniref:Transmembrane protein n=1 Tax=Steinernema carpocapsae TaxID=34508 RepID=A0A4V5ZZJ0_STECR|nr:hypothetical protein L596_023798 [Steinernema carpocapsae]
MREHACDCAVYHSEVGASKTTNRHKFSAMTSPTALFPLLSFFFFVPEPSSTKPPCVSNSSSFLRLLSVFIFSLSLS